MMSKTTTGQCTAAFLSRAGCGAARRTPPIGHDMRAVPGPVNKMNRQGAKDAKKIEE
jgi:hypothetical protein